MASTLEKLKAQHPSLYLPTDGSDDVDNDGLPDDIKPLSDMTNATPMDISRLVTHLSRVVAATREEVSGLLHELQPLKEKTIMLKDECDEKKKVHIFSFFRVSAVIFFSFALLKLHFIIEQLHFIIDWCGICSRTMHCRHSSIPNMR